MESDALTTGLEWLSAGFLEPSIKPDKNKYLQLFSQDQFSFLSLLVP